MLQFLEDRIQPGVVLGSFSGNYDTGTLSVSASAPSFTAMAQQMKAFQNDSRVSSVLIDGLDRQSGGTVEGSFTITFFDGAFLAQASGQ